MKGLVNQVSMFGHHCRLLIRMITPAVILRIENQEARNEFRDHLPDHFHCYKER